jgi:hypothetical protein
MCVASRPWLVFEDAFYQRPSLRVEDLTAPDIHLFVSQKLRENKMYAALEKLRPHNARHLILEVIGKASGVFLWVRLVIVSLLEGLRDGDGIADLQERLDRLPSDLQALFSNILGRLSPEYFSQASKLFQLVRASSEPLSLLDLSFAEAGFDTAMNSDMESSSIELEDHIAERMRRRLNSRCKSLLEARARPDERITWAKVEYLHRTVKDFLATPEIWKYIVSGVPEFFDPEVSFSGSYLLQIKSLWMSPSILKRFKEAVTRCIKHSLEFESTKPEFHIQTLKELDQVAINVFGQSHPDGGTWLENAARRLDRQDELNPPTHWTLGGVAVRIWQASDELVL